MCVYIIGTTLPTLQELYSSRVSKRAGKITLDPSHPAHSLFELLPSGRRYRALSTRTTRHRNSFLPSGYPSHGHLTLSMEHTTLFTLFIHHTCLIFNFNFAHIRPVHTQLSILYIVFLLFCTLPICILLFYYLCPVAVILLHCGASVTITNSSYV